MVVNMHANKGVNIGIKLNVNRHVNMLRMYVLYSFFCTKWF
jgi:hypothetical protein